METPTCYTGVMELERLPIEPDWSKYPVDLWGLADGDERGIMRMMLFRSSDEGRSWQHVYTDGSSLLGKEPTLVCMSDGTVLSVSDHPHGFRVSRSEDDGATWTVTSLGSEFIDEEPR